MDDDCFTRGGIGAVVLHNFIAVGGIIRAPRGTGGAVARRRGDSGDGEAVRARRRDGGVVGWRYDGWYAAQGE